jgi:Leucine-rich repeat (LRR) protein
MSDVKLKIRHAKRGNERAIDLSGMGLTEIPADINQLTSLESINLSGNRLTSLRGIEELQALREINAQNNKIAQLHAELQDLYTLESLNLIGNPIVNTHPKLARIENDEEKVQEALNTYFAAVGSFGGLNSMSSSNISMHSQHSAA